jgi:hypothetical protein
MNNDEEFVAPAQSLLLIIGTEGEDQQVHKNRTASI